MGVQRGGSSGWAAGAGSSGTRDEAHAEAEGARTSTTMAAGACCGGRSEQSKAEQSRAEAGLRGRPMRGRACPALLMARSARTSDHASSFVRPSPSPPPPPARPYTRLLAAPTPSCSFHLTSPTMPLTTPQRSTPRESPAAVAPSSTPRIARSSPHALFCTVVSSKSSHSITTLCLSVSQP